MFWGKEIRLDTGDLDGAVLGSVGTLPYEQELRLTKFFIKQLSKNDIFYDIGASYGFYTHLALEFCKEVHAFEPIPEAFVCLKESVAKNENVFCSNVALSDTNGSSFLSLMSKQDRTGGSIIAEKRNMAQEDTVRIPIQTITLDSYIKDHTKPTMVKIDVEGAEAMVLEGGKEFFQSNDPVISMEVLPRRSGGEISMRAVEKLREFGYRSYVINSQGELEPIEGDLSERIRSFENYIFKKVKPSPGTP